jgi:hypothetical protein
MNANALCRGVALAAMLLASMPRPAAADDTLDCAVSASNACYFSFTPSGSGGSLHYYASSSPGVLSPGPAPTVALVVVHGHPRDANKTFDAALAAVHGAGVDAATLIVAPVFQVDAARANKCLTAGVPAAAPGDLLWSCASWIDGGVATNDNALTSFAALDALIAELGRQWPSLRSITVAGFSAGGQMVQHYVGFAASLSAAAMSVRYVVADPGSWLYFDAVRPQPMQEDRVVDWAQCGQGSAFPDPCTLEFRVADDAACIAPNRWKYGTEMLPPQLRVSAAEARARYAAADIVYLEGGLDSGTAPGTYYRILDKSCAAEAQGPYRLQRGLAYAQYDRTLLAPDRHREVSVVPGCAHDVVCVFGAPAAREALLRPGH